MYCRLEAVQKMSRVGLFSVIAMTARSSGLEADLQAKAEFFAVSDTLLATRRCWFT